MCHVLYQPATDLFGDVVITHDDIFDYVAAISPRWLYPERSYKSYVKNYNIAGKVRAAKLAGVFEQIKNQRSQQWHPRLSLDLIL